MNTREKGMKHYPESLKDQIRQEYSQESSLHGLQRKYGVSDWSVHYRCGLSEKANTSQLSPLPKGRLRKNAENPEQLIQRLKMKNELLKNFL